ncbi:MAG: hypothetical protein WCA09_06260 [Burkholderiales bacterium]
MLTWVKRSWVLALLGGMVAFALLGTDIEGARPLLPGCMGTAPLKRVPIEATEGKFIPAEIDVAEGDCVELWIRATEGIAHSAVIESTGISSEGALLLDHHGRPYGRAMARENPNLSPVLLREGWFAKGEQVLLRFQAKEAGKYRLRCTVAETLSETEAQPMSVIIWVSANRPIHRRWDRGFL